MNNANVQADYQNDVLENDVTEEQINNLVNSLVLISEEVFPLISEGRRAGNESNVETPICHKHNEASTQTNASFLQDESSGRRFLDSFIQAHLNPQECQRQLQQAIDDLLSLTENVAKNESFMRGAVMGGVIVGGAILLAQILMTKPIVCLLLSLAVMSGFLPVVGWIVDKLQVLCSESQNPGDSVLRLFDRFTRDIANLISSLGLN